MDCVTLREAGPMDCAFVWKVRNSESVRAQSLRTDPIDWAEHTRWWSTGSKTIFVVESFGEDAGYVVVHYPPGRRVSVVSIALLSSCRGQGVGTQAIRLAVDATRKMPPRRVMAKILPTNEASRRAFRKAGFREVYQVWEHDGA